MLYCNKTAEVYKKKVDEYAAHYGKDIDRDADTTHLHNELIMAYLFSRPMPIIEKFVNKYGGIRYLFYLLAEDIDRDAVFDLATDILNCSYHRDCIQYDLVNSPNYGEYLEALNLHKNEQEYDRHHLL